MEIKTPWWRFALAIIVYLFSLLFLPPIIMLLREFLNFMLPWHFSGVGLLIYSRAYGTYLSINLVDLILEENHRTFVVVLSVVSAFYLVFVSSYNLAIGVSSFWEFISFIIAAIVAIVLSFKYKAPK